MSCFHKKSLLLNISIITLLRHLRLNHAWKKGNSNQNTVNIFQRLTFSVLHFGKRKHPGPNDYLQTVKGFKLFQGLTWSFLLAEINKKKNVLIYYSFKYQEPINIFHVSECLVMFSMFSDVRSKFTKRPVTQNRFI